MQNGWTLKRLHRQIMTSSVYRQSSHQPAEGETSVAKKVDPENHLLWRMNLLRLEAEVIRDSVLAASGKLDRTAGGPSILLAPRPEGLQTFRRKTPHRTPNTAAACICWHGATIRWSSCRSSTSRSSR
jgi:hypothetical protein